MFAGEFPCKLDDKGRFAMPASLREHFAMPGHLEVKKAVLVKSQQERCLWLFPLHHWYTLLEVQRQRLNERESRLFMHYVVSDVVEVEIDRASRVLVPRKLREHAGIGEDTVWSACMTAWRSGAARRGWCISASWKKSTKCL